MNNSPTVEFVMDALRVARATGETPKDPEDICAEWDAYLDTFDPPTVIALMEDWLRLRAQRDAFSDALVKIDQIQFDGAVADSLNDTTDYFNRIEEVARAALAKQG